MRRLIPFVAAFAASLTLASAAQAETPVAKSQRELVVLAANMSYGNNPVVIGLYESLEFTAWTSAAAILGPMYSRVTVLKEAAATRATLAATLDTITARTNVRAVDLVFVVHGLTNLVTFSNGVSRMDQVADAIQARLSAAQRAKLRAVFSTACYGTSHRAGWRAAGFKVAWGSRLIYADSAATYKSSLLAWGLGATFADVTRAANNADPLRVWDGVATGFLLAVAHPDWQEVNSFRVTSGDTSLRIGTMP